MSNPNFNPAYNHNIDLEDDDYSSPPPFEVDEEEFDKSDFDDLHKDFPIDEEQESKEPEKSEVKKNNNNFTPVETVEYYLAIKRSDKQDIKNAKKVLNYYLEDIPNQNPILWTLIAEDLQKDNFLNAKLSGKDQYLFGFFKILYDKAIEKKWQVAKDGETIYIYNQYWIKIDFDLFKEFLELVALKVGIPEFLYINSKFIKTVYLQLKQSSFFRKMQHPNRTMINLKNGTLIINSRGVKLSTFHPDDFLTYQLDFSYEKNRVNHQLLSFLDDVLPDKDTQKTLQQGIANLFIHSLKLEKVLFLYGTGANGKSVLFEIINGLLDPSLITHYSLESLVDSKGYERADLQNKLINYGSDINMLNIDFGIFKLLVSGEPVQVRPIYKQPFIMHRYAKMAFNVNKIDDVNVEQTIGFFRRMIFVPFEQTIPKEKQDKNLHNKILLNKAGILNWIIEGIEDVLANKEIFISKKCIDFLDNFKLESNLTARFVKEFSIKSSTDKTISFQNMYNKFKDFCKNEGEKFITKIKFNRELKKLNFESTRRAKCMVWLAEFN